MNGVVQTVNVPPSTRHSNVEGVSPDVNAHVGVVSLVAPLGPPVIVVSGATVSTVHVRVAGVASTLPTASRARTWNVCEPCDSPV